MGSRIYTASKIFTGEKWLEDHAIVVKDQLIEKIIPVGLVNLNLEKKNFDLCLIVPAFIDLQLYGAYEKLLAVYPEPGTLQKINDYCRAGGAAFCLPTVATNKKEVFYACIDAIRKYWEQNGKGVLGLHVEGPWINPLKRGAHIEELIHPPSVEEVKNLLEYGKDVIKIITLAPEMCNKEVIELIRSHHIIISAGHSNATYEQSITAFNNGINCVTHLYNAMSPLQHRSPGLVGATLDDMKVMASIIPDGHHVDYAAIRIAKNIMKERLFAITDTVAETNKGLYHHHLEGDKYTSDGILSGSALNMIKALQNLIKYVNVEPGEALRMCSQYPAKVLGLEKELGKIEKGYRACLSILDNNYNVLEVIAD